jgi:hypothetical protein
VQATKTSVERRRGDLLAVHAVAESDQNVGKLGCADIDVGLPQLGTVKTPARNYNEKSRLRIRNSLPRLAA